jgi:hypothetical protein
MKKLLPVFLALLLLLTSCSGDPAYVSGSVTVAGQPLTVTVDGQAVDPSGAAVIISLLQYQVHQGNAYSLAFVKDVASMGTSEVLIYTNNSVAMLHFVVNVETESESEYELFEAPTVSANGTIKAIYNRNRTSPNISQVDGYTTPTISGNGTQITQQHWGAGRGTGSIFQSINEWILAPDTYYLIRVTNQTNQPNQVSITLEWLELGN